MQALSNRRTHTWKRRIATVTVGSAVAILPLIGSAVTAQADPPRYAPAWGQRDRNDRDSRFHDRYGRTAIRRNDYSGTVQQTFGGNQFSLSLDGGGSLRVAAGNGVRGNFRTGERVTVHGYFTNDDSLFIADSLSVQSYRGRTRGNGGNYGGRYGR